MSFSQLPDPRDRRQIEETLRESEALFRALAENANAIIAIVQGRGFAYVNPHFSHLTGYSQDELLAMDISRIIAPASRALVLKRAQLRQAGDSSLPSRYEFAILSKDGRERWLDFSAARIDYHGQPAIVGIAYDITERRQAEQERERLLGEVQRRATELDAILDAIVDPTAAFDANGILIRANPAMVLTIGHDPTGMTHAEIARVLSMRRPDGTLLKETETPIIRALRGEAVVGERLLLTDCDGHIMIVLISAAPLFEQARPWGVVSIWHDISKRERLLEEVERRAAELDATVTRLNELQDRMRSMLQIVSHDLRNPLGVIKGHIDLLAEVLPGMQTDELAISSIRAIQRSVQRMNTLIEDLVDTARVEGGQLQLKQEAYPLRECLIEFLQLNAGVLETGRIRLDVPGDLPPAWADYSRLERIFTNLLSNALKYSDPGTPVWIPVAGRRSRRYARDRHYRPGERHSRGGGAASLRAFLPRQGRQTTGRPRPGPVYHPRPGGSPWRTNPGGE